MYLHYTTNKFFNKTCQLPGKDWNFNGHISQCKWAFRGDTGSALLLSVSQKNELLVTQSMEVHPPLQLELQPWLHSPDNLLSFHTPLSLTGLDSQHSVLLSLIRTHPRSKQELIESPNFVKYNRGKPYCSLSELSAQYSFSAPEHQTAVFLKQK